MKIQAANGKDLEVEAIGNNFFSFVLADGRKGTARLDDEEPELIVSGVRARIALSEASCAALWAASSAWGQADEEAAIIAEEARPARRGY